MTTHERIFFYICVLVCLLTVMSHSFPIPYDFLGPSQLCILKEYFKSVAAKQLVSDHSEWKMQHADVYL